jgi:uncharacterized damage-inducible protein DinB
MSVFTNPSSDSKAAGAAYTAALLDLLGDQDPMKIWRETPDAVDSLTEGLSPREAATPEREGKWCIAQVVSHLVDSEIVYAYRMRRIVAEETPVIAGYDQDRWASRLGYADESLDDLRTELRTLRRRNLRFVERLDEEELDRYGRHDERGNESIRHLVRMLAAHDLLHRNQLQRIRDAISRPA